MPASANNPGERRPPTKIERNGGRKSSNSEGIKSRQRRIQRKRLLLLIFVLIIVTGLLISFEKIRSIEFLGEDRVAPSNGLRPRLRPKRDQLQETSQSNSQTENKHNALEQHYQSVYKSVIITKEARPKFVLFRLNSKGIGNKIRALAGAMFLAAVTDRVLLVDSKDISLLFEPPVIDGIKLDWNTSLAHGACDNGISLPADPKLKVYTPQLIHFDRHYGSETCIIANATHGHDRQVLSLNEDTYKNKVLQLFGNTSRFSWTRDSLALVLQRPSEAFSSAGMSAMKRLQLNTVQPSNRIAVHVRTFFNEVDKFYADLRTQDKNIMNCVESLVKAHIVDLSQEPNATTVLFETDSPQLMEEAKNRLGAIDGIRVINSGPIFHTELSEGNIDKFVPWFLMGECKTIIATGWSSFGLTSYFRPAAFPKALFTVDDVFKFKRHTNMKNPKCGRVESGGEGPRGWTDINFGIHDPLYDEAKLKEALASLVNSGVEAGESLLNTSLNLTTERRSVQVPTFFPQKAAPKMAAVTGRNLSVISYSIFGNQTKYAAPLIFDAQKYVPNYYPHWQMRIYHDESVPIGTLEELRRHSHVRLVNVEDRSEPLLNPGWFEWLPRVPPTVWRFLVASDPTVDAFIIRDADAIPTERERAAVDEWLKSGATFHIMHDFPIHFLFFKKEVVMMAGMWGGRGGRACANMSDLIRYHYEQNEASNFTDQDFLALAIWPLVQAEGPGGSVRHNSFHCEENGGVAFPSAGEWDLAGYDFVGEQVKVKKAKSRNNGEGWRSLVLLDDARSGACWVKKFFMRSKWRLRYMNCIAKRNETGVHGGYSNETGISHPPVLKCDGGAVIRHRTKAG